MGDVLKHDNRIEIIDVLRGFALMTVWLVHVSGEFAGWSSLFIDTTTKSALPTAGMDKGVDFLVYLFLANKSRLLFAFLFGTGFYFQLNNANRTGGSITKKFLKRLAFLFTIGVLHAYLLWSGDLFRVYAVCGIFLLLVHKWKPNWLLAIAVILTVIVPAITGIVRNYHPSVDSSAAVGAMIYNGYKGHLYAGLIKANILRDKVVYGDIYVIGGFLVVMIGNFIFGYLAAKAELFRKLVGNNALLNKIMLLSLLSGILFSPSFVRVLVQVLHYNAPLPLFVANLLALPTAFSYQAMALFLMVFVIVLYNNPRSKRAMQLLIPLGQMTLTNYIMQSVFGVAIFFGVGFGLFGKYGATAGFAIGLVLLVFQVWYSTLWLRHFTMGPLEYVWRSISTARWQTMRRQLPVKKQLAVISKN